MNRGCTLIVLFAFTACLQAADVDLAARATNEVGVDLYRQLATGDENLCLSPYSIEAALAMTFAGAEGDTRSEMARVLHFPGDGEAIHSSFDSLQRALNEMAKKTVKIAEESKRSGGPSEPIRFPSRTGCFRKRVTLFAIFSGNWSKSFTARRLSRSITARIPSTRASTLTNGWRSKRTIVFAI